jgi:glutamyl-tRNA reductase
MFSDIVLIHRTHQAKSALPASPLAASASPTGAISDALPLAQKIEAVLGSENAKTWFQWKTCLREVVIGEQVLFASVHHILSPVDQVYFGEDAYRFLLETICGLHSPLMGETEVYGQFKNAVTNFALPVTPWGSHLKRFFRAMFEDAKRIRQAHLEDLGSQSYGSVLRRELKGVNRIHIIGAGQFVQEILPWIAKDGNQIHIHARDPEKAKTQLAGQLKPEYQIHDLKKSNDFTAAEVVIVAAPVDGATLESWLKDLPELKILADLRADSATDRPQVANPHSNFRHLVLADVFQSVSQNQAVLAERKKIALAAVQQAVYERSLHVEYRPFGWEDVCA